MATLFRTQPLIAPQQPRLPAAPVEYSQRYGDDLTNILRLYFNQLQNFNQLFTTNTGGALLQFPNGAFHQDGVTALTGSMTNNGTTPIQVTTTANFSNSGTLLIEDELVGYTGKTSTTFTGITRGIYGSTNVSHSIGVAVAEAQGVVSASTALAIPFDSTDASNGVSIDATHSSRIVFDVAGYYNVQFSAQMINLTAADDLVRFWFRKDGNDIANSAGVVFVPKQAGAATPGAVIISWNLVVDVTANSYIELYYSTKTGNTVCATYPAGTSPVTPVSPSVILTATFVSALYT